MLVKYKDLKKIIGENHKDVAGLCIQCRIPGEQLSFTNQYKEFEGVKEFQLSFAKYLENVLPEPNNPVPTTLMITNTLCGHEAISRLQIVPDAACQWMTVHSGEFWLIMAPPKKENIEYAEFFREKTELEFSQLFKIESLIGARFSKLRTGDTVFIPGGWLAAWVTGSAKSTGDVSQTTAEFLHTLPHRCSQGSFYANTLLKMKPDTLLLAKHSRPYPDDIPHMALEEFVHATLLDTTAQFESQTLAYEAMMKIPQFCYIAASVSDEDQNTVFSLKANYVETKSFLASTDNRGILSWTEDEKSYMQRRVQKALEIVHKTTGEFREDEKSLSILSNSFISNNLLPFEIETSQELVKKPMNDNDSLPVIHSPASDDSWCLIPHSTVSSMVSEEQHQCSGNYTCSYSETADASAFVDELVKSNNASDRKHQTTMPRGHCVKFETNKSVVESKESPYRSIGPGHELQGKESTSSSCSHALTKKSVRYDPSSATSPLPGSGRRKRPNYRRTGTSTLTKQILLPKRQRTYNFAHQTTCHLCGNLRSGCFKCPKCPKVFCTCCTEKKLYEHGEASFTDGCPGCRGFCCCSQKSTGCSNLFHCYRKCPLTKKGKRPRVKVDTARYEKCTEMAEYLVAQSEGIQ